MCSGFDDFNLSSTVLLQNGFDLYSSKQHKLYKTTPYDCLKAYRAVFLCLPMLFIFVPLSCLEKLKQDRFGGRYISPTPA